MHDKIKHFFRKTPGERMPNNLGWLVVGVVDLVLIAFAVIGISFCNSGCSHTSSVTRRGPGGDTTMRSVSYVGGLVTEYNEEYDSDGDYTRCLTDRRTQRVAGGAWIWSDDQMTCYWQTSGATGVGGMPMGSAYGYAWGAPPSLVITPGLR